MKSPSILPRFAQVTDPTCLPVISALGLPPETVEPAPSPRQAPTRGLRYAHPSPSPTPARDDFGGGIRAFKTALFVLGPDALPDSRDGPGGGGALSPAAGRSSLRRYTGSFAQAGPLDDWLRRTLDELSPQPDASNGTRTSATNLSPVISAVVDWAPVPVSMPDLAAAVEFALQNDVPLAFAAQGVLSGDALDALRSFLLTLSRFFPSPDNRAVLDRVRLVVENASAGRGNVTIEQWTVALRAPATADGAFQLPVPALSPGASREFRECAGSRPELRGYPCSLWLLFHVLLMNADTSHAAPVLASIVGYIGYFFSCLECRNHFLGMLGDLSSQLQYGIAREEGALWLWSRHNAVNLRLNATGGVSNDPAHPKLIFPPKRACPSCYDESGELRNDPAILGFLREAYCSREPGDAAFACARERAAIAAARAGSVEGGAYMFSSALLTLGCCALCLLLAALPWLCHERFASVTLQLERAEDRKLGERLDREADHAAVAAATAAAAAAVTVATVVASPLTRPAPPPTARRATRSPAPTPSCARPGSTSFSSSLTRTRTNSWTIMTRSRRRSTTRRLSSNAAPRSRTRVGPTSSIT
mmetsp:Transcript_44092/g.101916  ORF Transcript_44092/g.101916 Transcript_44092/m.101916 type:complete len:591 (-) Transcript_44092:1238-3010(-)